MDSTIPEIKLEHADARGEIYSIALPDNRELMLLHSKAGSLRGGHSHSCDEIVVLLTGKMRYYKRCFNKDNIFVMTPEGLKDLYAEGEPSGNHQGRAMQIQSLSINEAGEVHMGEFLEDSWVLEYKFAEKGHWSQEDYEPWRERVRASQG